jgi:segregation and condensation protein A
VEKPPLTEPHGPGEALSPALPPVQISTFSGPFDLLLHLIRVNEVSITDIPIAEITEQYTAYLDLMQELDLDIAAEYIYMASLLIYIKSRSLLPQETAPGAVDPREELIARLLEYEKFKRTAESFHEVDTLRAGLWPRAEIAPPGVPPEAMTFEVSLVDLVGAFRLSLERYRLAHPETMEVHHPRFSIREKMIELIEKLSPGESLPLLEFLGTFHYRAEAITSFLAVLELVRLQVLRALQPVPFGEIHVRRTDLAFDVASIREDYRD